jgi:hypothetical protein
MSESDRPDLDSYRPQWNLRNVVWFAVAVLFLAGTLATIVLKVYAFGENGLRHIDKPSPGRFIDIPSDN